MLLIFLECDLLSLFLRVVLPKVSFRDKVMGDKAPLVTRHKMNILEKQLVKI